MEKIEFTPQRVQRPLLPNQSSWSLFGEAQHSVSHGGVIRRGVFSSCWAISGFEVQILVARTQTSSLLIVQAPDD